MLTSAEFPKIGGREPRKLLEQRGSLEDLSSETVAHNDLLPSTHSPVNSLGTFSVIFTKRAEREFSMRLSGSGQTKRSAR